MGNILTGHKIVGRLVCHAADQDGIMVFAYKCSSFVGTGANAQALADFIGTTYATALKALMYNDAEYRGCGVVNLTEDPVLDEVRSTIGAGAGTAGDVPMPLDTCGLIRKRTGVRGGKGRGRAYVPFPSAADLGNEGDPHDDYVLKLDALKTLWVNNISFGAGGNTSALVPCLVNQVTMNFTPIISVSSADVWANQHRRGSFGAQNPVPF